MGPWCRAMSDDARLSCSQPLIGSLTGFSYLSSSWDVTGVAPGHAWIDASGAVVGDRSERFMSRIERFLRLRLAEPFLASVVFWSRSWSSILFMKLLIGGDLPIYRSSVSNLPIIERGAVVVALVPGGSVGPWRVQGLLHLCGLVNGCGVRVCFQWLVGTSVAVSSNRILYKMRTERDRIMCTWNFYGEAQNEASIYIQVLVFHLRRLVLCSIYSQYPLQDNDTFLFHRDL